MTDMEARLRAATNAGARVVTGSPGALDAIRTRITRQRRQARIRATVGAVGLVAVTATAVIAVDSRIDNPSLPPTAGSRSPAPAVPTASTKPNVAPTRDPGVVGADELVAVEYVGTRKQIVLVSTQTGRTTKLLRYNVNTVGTDLGVDVSPDRRTVYYSTLDMEHSDSNGTKVDCGGVYAMTLADGVVRPVVALGQKPRVSPDGRWLAMLTGCPVDQLTILDLHTGARRNYPLAPTLAGPTDVPGLHLDPVRDYAWTARGTLAMLGWTKGDGVLRLLLFDPATDRRIGDSTRVDVFDGYWQVRARGDDLLLSSKYRIDLRDGRTGTVTQLVAGSQGTFIVGLMAVGPDGTAVYRRGQQMWFVDPAGRQRSGPPLQGDVADW